MHMLKNRAPPDKFGVLYQLLHIEFHGFNSMDRCFRVITLWLLVVTQFLEITGACPGFLKGGGPISLGSLKKGHQMLKGGPMV